MGPLINLLRQEVKVWRDATYPNTTRVTKELLHYWFLDPTRENHLFFAQREAIETAIWLNEVAEKSNPGQHALSELARAQAIDRDPINNLPRFAFKMATGTGKTVVMGALISKQAVNNAPKACRRRGDADWLILLGFSFESDIESKSVTTSQGQFQVTKVRMHDDLLQEGLLKKDKKAASFVTIGEPDVALHQKKGEATVEIKGLDIYDPIKDEVKSRDVHDIAYWMVDTDYDGANFIVRQAFFCGGDQDEFVAWKKASKTSPSSARRRKPKRP